MLRMPLIKMCSRETHRLSVNEVRLNLGCKNQSLPVESQGFPTASEIFFVYHIDSSEVPFGKARFHFFLVEVNKNVETILDFGAATETTPIGPRGRYLYFGGKGDKLRDDYGFLCPTPEGYRNTLDAILEPFIGHFAPNGVKEM